jgi:Bacterial protein of unknown function (Gcw_chp)
MRRAKAGGAVVYVAVMLGGAVPAQAQATFGVDLDLFSSYVWRGLTLTNKPVAEPGLWVSFPAGNASITVGGWANIDLGQYDDTDDDISESGGTSAFNLSEFDPYAEISFPAGKATLTGGVTGYIYPNDLDDAPNGGLDSEANTVEVYGKLGFDVPLSPELSVYYDVDKIKGAYIEANLSHSLAASETISFDLGAAAGFSAGQGIPDDLLSDESFNFADDGFTHLDLSAGVPFAAGAISITPVIHLVIAGDDFTKVSSPSNVDSDTKLWGGVSLSWSNEVEEEEPEAPASPE